MILQMLIGTYALLLSIVLFIEFMLAKAENYMILQTSALFLIAAAICVRNLK